MAMSLLQSITRSCRICIVLVVIISTQKRGVWSTPCAKSPVCHTSECEELADLYLNGINKDGSPCDDFYDYVCRGWKRRYEVLDYDDMWTVDTDMTIQALKDIQSLLESKVVSSREMIEKAKKLYRICMRIPFVPRSPSSVVKEIMTQNNPWPMFIPKFDFLDQKFPWWQVDNYYVKHTGKSALFDLLVQADPEHHYEPIIQIQRISSPYGSLQRTLPWTPSEKTNYMEYLHKLISSVAPYNTTFIKVKIDRELKEVVNFRIEINKIIEKVKDFKFVRFTVSSLQKWYNLQTTQKEICKINWLQQLFVLYKGRTDHPQVLATDLVVIDSMYVIRLCGLLTKTRNRVILNHIHLYFLEKHLAFTNATQNSAFKSITNGFQFTGKFIHPLQRWMECIIDHNMKQTLAMMYIKKYFPKTKKNAVKRIINSAKKLLELQIMQSTWLDADTKQKSISYVRDLQSIVGYPDYYDDPNTANTQNRIHMNPLIPGAHLIKKKLLSVTAAYLQWPVFLLDVPYVVNFGSFTSVIGHELYHVFNKSGVKRIDNVCGNNPWWPRSMCAKHTEKTMCFVEHYANYTEELLKSHSLYGHFNPYTVEEDIPDAMGLKLAYLDFEQKLAQSHGVCPVLPGFEKDGCHKLFFIAFANGFCSSATPEAELRRLLVDNHSLPSIRVNAAVSNMKEFNTAFKCNESNRLYAKNTCDLWL